MLFRTRTRSITMFYLGSNKRSVEPPMPIVDTSRFALEKMYDNLHVYVRHVNEKKEGVGQRDRRSDRV